MPNYWVVGATVDGQDMTESFVDHGIWFSDAEGSQDKIRTIEPGDRMAIKRMLGHGSPEVALKALGVVEKVEQYNALKFRMIYVKWIRVQDKKVPFQGFGAAVHGPFAQAEAFALHGDIFRL